jgi:pyruvate dehydrogenase E1 component alpha subunit
MSGDEAALPSAESLREWLYTMLLIRRFEERAGEMYARAKIGGFLHLAIGEEATIVGCARALRAPDYLVSTYRSHGHALVRGTPPGTVMAELFGKATGCSKGRGGSMHMFDGERRFMGGYGIVGGNLPIAGGLALASAYTGEGSVTLCTLGDGACNQGTFGETMNLCALWRLPIVFLVTNNLFGMGTALERHSAVTELCARGEGYGVPGVRCDGMDVIDTYRTVCAAVERAREKRAPQLVEAITYRFRGHSMADPERYRTREQVQEWRERDPIETFPARLAAEGKLAEGALAELDARARQAVDEAVDFAERSPFPEPEALYEDIYVLGEQVRGSYSLRTTDPRQGGPSERSELAATGEIARQITAALATGQEARASALPERAPAEPDQEADQGREREGAG